MGRGPAMSTYVVTGGTGFLGEELVGLLLARGCKVRVIARSAGRGGDRTGLEHVKGTINDYDTLVRCFQGAAGVYHLAGVVEMSRRPEAAKRIDEVNIDGTLNVIRAARQAGVARVVYASTSGTVGVSREEQQVFDDASPYANEVTEGWPYYRSKIRAEEQGRALAKRLGVELVCMRPSLLLGPGDKRLSSTRTVLDLINKKVPFMPKGGLSVVDVRDAAATFVTAMDKAAGGSTYLLGSANLTLKEYFGKVCAAAGVKPPWLEIPDVASWAMAATVYGVKGVLYRWDPSYDPVLVEMGQVFWYIDSAAARGDLGFQPRDVDATIQETVEWMLANRGSLDAS